MVTFLFCLFYHNFLKSYVFYWFFCVGQQDSKEGILKCFFFFFKGNAPWRTRCLELCAIGVLRHILFCLETFWHPWNMQRHLGITNEGPGTAGTQNRRSQETKKIHTWAYENPGGGKNCPRVNLTWMWASKSGTTNILYLWSSSHFMKQKHS